MADNTQLNSGSGGDTIRDKDRSGVKTQIVALDLNPSGSETLMSAAALADAASNPTTFQIGACIQAWNGTGWDRLQADGSKNLKVNVQSSALPTGAATAAKQPALGTAGSASADVLTIQGIASMTPVLVTLSGNNNLTGNQAVNLAQVAGASIAQGHGTAASAIRVELPTDGTGTIATVGTVTTVTTVTTVSAVTAITNALPAGSNVIGQVETKKYTGPASGELAGATSATQMPNVSCSLVKFKACAANAGKVYIGTSSSVTKVDGSTDTTTGLQLSAGEETGWIPVDNANRFYRICDNAGDALTYLALA